MKAWWKRITHKISHTPFPELLEEGWTLIRELRAVRAFMIVGYIIIVVIVGRQGFELARMFSDVSRTNNAMLESREAILLTGDIMVSVLALEGSLKGYSIGVQDLSKDWDGVIAPPALETDSFTVNRYITLINQKLTQLSLLSDESNERLIDSFTHRVHKELDHFGDLGKEINAVKQTFNEYQRLSSEQDETGSAPDTALGTVINDRIRRIIELNANSTSNLIALSNHYNQLRRGWRIEVEVSSDELDSTRKRMIVQTVIVLLLMVMMLLVLLVVIFNYISQNRAMQSRLEEEKDSAETLAEVKQRFLANMSHEIRNPLHAIIGFAEQLGQTSLARNQRHLLKPLQRSARYLLALINDVLDFSKIDSQNLVLEQTGFSLREVFEEVDSTFASQAQKKNIEFHTSYDEQTPDVVLGDSLRLRQMLLNLVGNAVKFTEKGAVHFDVSMVMQEKEDVLMNFTITDTGIGIPASLQQQIFSEWTQVDSKTTRKYGGTGLGLAITARLAELHQGQLNLESEEGNGTTIQLSIPYRLGSEQDLEHSNRTDPGADEQSWKGKRVLVADDEPFNRTLMEILLQKMDINPELVENGLEAWNRLQSQEYDLVLLDLQMPEMDGFEVAKKTREHLPKDLPLIAVTATATRNETNRAKEAGMNEILLKPFEEKDLVRIFSRYFSVTDEPDHQTS